MICTHILVLVVVVLIVFLLFLSLLSRQAAQRKAEAKKKGIGNEKDGRTEKSRAEQSRTKTIRPCLENCRKQVCQIRKGAENKVRFGLFDSSLTVLLYPVICFFVLGVSRIVTCLIEKGFLQKLLKGRPRKEASSGLRREMALWGAVAMR